MKGRYHASLVSLRDKLYLFGGYFHGVNGTETLNDFYYTEFKLPFGEVQAKAKVRRIVSSNNPEIRGESQLIVVDNYNICLFGGRN